MSRFSFFVAIFIVLAGCLIVASGDPIVPIIDTGGFVDDFFGSDSSAIIPAGERERAKKLIEAQHKVPRYTFFTSNYTLTKVPSRFCLPRGYASQSGENASEEHTYGLGDCDWSDYIESLVLISFAAFVIAIIIFPFMYCGLSLGRCCCCGKYRPTPDLCAGDPEDFEPTTNGYTDCCVLVLVILAIAACVVMAVGAGVGLWGSVTMTNGIHTMANFTNKTAYTLADIVDSVVDILAAVDDINIVSLDTDTIANAQKATGTIKNLTDDIVTYAGIIDTPRQIFMYVTLLLPLVLMLLVVIGRFVGCIPCCCWMPWGMTFLGFILAFLSLVTFGVLYPLSSGIADVCVFLDEATADPDADTFINYVFNCGPNSPLASITETADEMFNTAGGLACDVFDAMDLLQYPCEKEGGTIQLDNKDNMCTVLTFDKSINCSLGTFSTITRNAVIYDRKIGCFEETENAGEYKLVDGTCGSIKSIFDTCEKGTPFYCNCKDEVAVNMSFCADNCQNEDLKHNATTFLKYSEIAAKVFDLYNEKITPYLNCESVVGITNRAKDFICVTMINAVSPMYIGEIIGCAGCLFGTFVALLSTKRFRRKYRRKYAIVSNASTELNTL